MIRAFIPAAVVAMYWLDEQDEPEKYRGAINAFVFTFVLVLFL